MSRRKAATPVAPPTTAPALPIRPVWRSIPGAVLALVVALGNEDHDAARNIYANHRASGIDWPRWLTPAQLTTLKGPTDARTLRS